MPANLQRRVQRYGWDRAAAHYERFWKDALDPAQKLLMELARLQPGERVLDVACGTGLVTLPAARVVGGAGAVVGTDISDAMVVATRDAAVHANLANVTTERADAETLGLPDASFDTVLCALGLMYVPDPLQAMLEMYRVLRSGGRAVAAVWGRRSRCGWAEVFPIVDHRVSSEVCPLFFQLGGEGALEYAFREAGFVELEAECIATELHFGSADDACGAAFAGGPVAMAYARFDEPTRAAVHQEYLESIAPHRDGDGYAIPGEFVVVGGVKP